MWGAYARHLRYTAKHTWSTYATYHAVPFDLKFIISRKTMLIQNDTNKTQIYHMSYIICISAIDFRIQSFLKSIFSSLRQKQAIFNPTDQGEHFLPSSRHLRVKDPTSFRGFSTHGTSKKWSFVEPSPHDVSKPYFPTGNVSFQWWFHGGFMVIDSLLRLPQLSQKVPAETAFEAAGDAHFVSLWLGEGLDL